MSIVILITIDTVDTLAFCHTRKYDVWNDFECHRNFKFHLHALFSYLIKYQFLTYFQAELYNSFEFSFQKLVHFDSKYCWILIMKVDRYYCTFQSFICLPRYLSKFNIFNGWIFNLLYFQRVYNRFYLDFYQTECRHFFNRRMILKSEIV